jgi:hypothetical protein
MNPYPDPDFLLSADPGSGFYEQKELHKFKVGKNIIFWGGIFKLQDKSPVS